MNISIVGRHRITLTDKKTGRIKRRSKWIKNIIPNVGIYAILDRLADEQVHTDEGIITYGAVGIGASTPVAGDTIMNDEVFRKAISTFSRTDNVLSITSYFTDAEANDALTQYALFGEEATGVADTGTMFAYLNFDGTYTKTASEEMTIDSEISIEEI